MRRFLLLLALLASPVASFAWSHGGHMLVAQIAYDRLNPRAKAEADRLLALSIDPVDVTATSTNFVDASHWADDVKRLPGFEFSKPLHFVDVPFSADGTPLPANLPATNNVIRALQDYVAVLRTSTNDTERAAALRYILHFTGDIHQPLHCVSRVTRRWPDGDQGGNKFWINNPIPDTKPDHINLHAYWDDGLYSFPKMGPHYAPPPLAEIVAAAPSIVAEHPPTESGWKAGGPFAFAAWAKESTQLAQSVVYAGIAQYRVPDERYRENGIKLSRQRVAWAGYRLAELLNTLWPEQH